MKKVLIANRGEIAVRIIRACRDLGLATVAVYSEADAEAMHVHMADEAICIGEAPSAKSYLKVASLIAACEVTSADAIHPGYGFLSENANFASICESSGLTFIGPPSQAIALLGDKAAAKAAAKSVGCPTIPGSDGIVDDVEQGLKVARAFGFPIFIKAVAGGGGKGIRIAYSEDDFVKKFVAARTEAQASFHNPSVYLEKMIVEPRHVEVQVIGDAHGNYLYLGERDCTIQRRRQKLIEEGPSPCVSEDLRKKMGQCAVDIVRAAKYVSAGTVEFLLDAQGHFYFMEVNTRIQVEHTVTEELTGIDLLEQQLRIARGEKLPWTQKDISLKGHVIEFRINAEDPANQFAPSPGVLEHYIPPGGPHVRIDSACYSGYKIPPNYDSMIAKLIVRGRDRQEAIARSKRALKEFLIEGVKSTIPFHKYMLEHPKFISSEANITTIDKMLDEGCKFEP
ncbi:MAG: Biotin carboxylase 1 [Chlamydiota bacterium]|jgi:acetyl-CoA carboxylase biotin carboxylase subunit